MTNLIRKGKKIFTSPQTSILSAATVIMFMIVVSRVLGLVRQRILAHFFLPSELSLFFAAFRLPDTIFEVLVFGTFSSAFIPVFSKLVDKKRKDAWDLAGTISTIGFSAFILVAIIVSVFADDLYGLLAAGYTDIERDTVVQLTKILFAAQGFFVLSYVLTGVLESLRRFLVPALAPLFYNLGIILGTIFLSPRLGLVGPTVGVFIGASLHFLIQLPLAVKLGYRVKLNLKINDHVKKIGKLAMPRIIELVFVQAVKSVELYLSSFISTASYAYYYFGNTIQLLPVGLFGTSIAKAALPTLSKQSDDLGKFRRSLWSSLYQVVFMVAPLATILIVLRIPIVRLVFGTEIFDWESTVRTGQVVSAFALGVVFQASISLLARAFYALHETKTPVLVSIFSMVLIVVLNFVFIRSLNLPVWGLAVSYSLGSMLQAITLYLLLAKRTKVESIIQLSVPFLKHLLASISSGVVMYVLMKFFDRSVWVKRLSFLGRIEASKTINFERFVLDTRFTLNLLFLTIVVSAIGGAVYILVSMFLKTKEVWIFFNLVKRTFIKRKVAEVPEGESESVIPPQTDTQN
ncbi:murein biosynthesis integral membrane protein MurJ [Candidatus Woesebacteria bacterium]|nr:murein biosynthesis integral membrane protein MurJ [Candidatus Woesebacteria bacterium]